jgi:hypothetical protein
MVMNSGVLRCGMASILPIHVCVALTWFTTGRLEQRDAVAEGEGFGKAPALRPADSVPATFATKATPRERGDGGTLTIIAP